LPPPSTGNPKRETLFLKQDSCTLSIYCIKPEVFLFSAVVARVRFLNQEQQEVPVFTGTSLGNLSLKLYNILSLISFRTFGNVEFNVIAFIQRFEAAGLNCGMVHENIIPRIAPDKSVAFFIVKPLNYALFFHFSSFFIFASNPARRAGIYTLRNVCFRTIRYPRGVETKLRTKFHIQTL
jgi:hypothetical protein